MNFHSVSFSLQQVLQCSLNGRFVLDYKNLSAVDEAATIDVLCSDKTGTLTRNELSVTSVKAMPGFDEAHILGIAALASSEGGDDSVDAAIRSASTHKPASDLPKLIAFVPFDPAKKTSARCLSCHGEAHEQSHFAESAHSSSDVGCLDCHSPHHAKEKEFLLVQEQPQLCYGCHISAKADFAKPYHHRVAENLPVPVTFGLARSREEADEGRGRVCKPRLCA